MPRILGFFAALVLVSSSAAPAWAWGCSGHEVVALIARQQLLLLDARGHSHVLAAVENLLAIQNHAYPGRYCSDLNLDPMAFYASWADDRRADDPATGPWHYWDIPLYQTSAALGQYCDKGCVVQALQQQIAILRDRTRPDAERGIALLFVIHFVGDMHQPLHEEDNDDRGGNCVPVTFLDHAARDSEHGGFGPNLHAVWDTALVETIGGISRQSPSASQQVAAFASRLSSQNAALIRRSARAPVDIVAWANQTHQLARQAVYSDLQPPIAPVAAGVPGRSCPDTATAYFNLHETAGEPYVAQVRPAVEQQLSIAGARLAGVLYDTLR